MDSGKPKAIKGANMSGTIPPTMKIIRQEDPTINRLIRLAMAPPNGVAA